MNDIWKTFYDGSTEEDVFNQIKEEAYRLCFTLEQHEGLEKVLDECFALGLNGKKVIEGEKAELEAKQEVKEILSEDDCNVPDEEQEPIPRIYTIKKVAPEESKQAAPVEVVPESEEIA